LAPFNIKEEIKRTCQNGRGGEKRPMCGQVGWGRSGRGGREGPWSILTV